MMFYEKDGGNDVLKMMAQNVESRPFARKDALLPIEAEYGIIQVSNDKTTEEPSKRAERTVLC